jgi:hypothetical protein
VRHVFCRCSEITSTHHGGNILHFEIGVRKE